MAEEKEEETLSDHIEQMIHGYAENSLEMQKSDDDPYLIGFDLEFEEFIIYWGSEFLQRTVTDPLDTVASLTPMDEGANPTIEEFQDALLHVLSVDSLARLLAKVDPKVDTKEEPNEHGFRKSELLIMQSCRVSFKGLPVESQKLLLHQLADEHAYYVKAKEKQDEEAVG